MNIHMLDQGEITHKVFDGIQQLNPQQIQNTTQQIRCRICYDSNRPLISVCACSGTIAFVHEDCILDWITKKIQASSIVQIPYCEICHQQYLARMKIGKKKICRKILLQKIIQLSWFEKMTTLFHLTAAIFALISIILFIRLVFTGSLFQLSITNILASVFTKLISQVYIFQTFKNHFVKRKRLFYDSMVQIVEVTLQPKIALRD